MRKISVATAATAVILIASFAGTEKTGASALAADASAEALPLSEAALTDEVVPVFAEGEVIQDLPEEPEYEIPANIDATSLRELVSEIPTNEDLSDEMRCLAGAIYFESRGEALEGQLAVAKVIINRTESHRFPSSYCDVVYQRAQFSFVRGGKMPRIKQNSLAWKRAKAIAYIAHQGLWDSAAEDSLYFHARYVKPSWAKRKITRATIDTHVFYR